MIRYLILKTQPAEPAIGKVQMHLLAKTPLRANAKTVADDQHANDQLGIDRGSAGMAVKRGEMSTQLGEIEEAVYVAKQVAGRNVIVEVEGVKQSVLTTTVLSHHYYVLPKSWRSLRPRASLGVQQSFSTK